MNQHCRAHLVIFLFDRLGINLRMVKSGVCVPRKLPHTRLCMDRRLESEARLASSNFLGKAFIIDPVLVVTGFGL